MWLRPAMWRCFVSDALYGGWVLLAGGFSAVLALRNRDQPSVVAVGLLVLAWCLYSGWRQARATRSKVRVLSSGIVTLRLDDLGARVRTPYGNLDGAFLAWADCAAVVVSRAPRGVGGPVPVARYIQLVPLRPDAVEGEPRSTDQRAAMLDLSPTDARTAWLELPGSRPTALDVAAWLRTRRPGLRLVGADG